MAGGMRNRYLVGQLLAGEAGEAGDATTPPPRRDRGGRLAVTASGTARRADGLEAGGQASGWSATHPAAVAASEVSACRIASAAAFSMLAPNSGTGDLISPS